MVGSAGLNGDAGGTTWPESRFTTCLTLAVIAGGRSAVLIYSVDGAPVDSTPAALAV